MRTRKHAACQSHVYNKFLSFFTSVFILIPIPFIFHLDFRIPKPATTADSPALKRCVSASCTQLVRLQTYTAVLSRFAGSARCEGRAKFAPRDSGAVGGGRRTRHPLPLPSSNPADQPQGTGTTQPQDRRTSLNCTSSEVIETTKADGHHCAGGHCDTEMCGEAMPNRLLPFPRGCFQNAVGRQSKGGGGVVTARFRTNLDQEAHFSLTRPPLTSLGSRKRIRTRDGPLVRGGVIMGRRFSSHRRWHGDTGGRENWEVVLQNRRARKIPLGVTTSARSEAGRVEIAANSLTARLPS